MTPLPRPGMEDGSGGGTPPVTAVRVPLTTEDAARIVAHIHEDHLSELLLAVRAFTRCAAPQDARITALYPDGLDVEVRSAEGATRHFIALTPAGREGRIYAVDDSIRWNAPRLPGFALELARQWKADFRR